MMSVLAAPDTSAADEQHQPELRVNNGAAAEEGVAVTETTKSDTAQQGATSQWE